MAAPEREDRPKRGPIGAAGERLLDDLLAEHFVQRRMADDLTLAAAGAIEGGRLRTLKAFLIDDLPRHVAFEEDAFFPALRRRCPPEDGIEKLLDILAREHADDLRLGAAAAEAVCGLIEGAPLTETQRSLLRNFAAHLRGHLALENGVLLPVARVRLDGAGLERLSQRRAQGRPPAARS